MDGNKPDPGIETILAQALEKTGPGERAAFLDQTCGHDFVLRQSLETMIEEQVRASGSSRDVATGRLADAVTQSAASHGSTDP
jgi:hypothetical protein